MKPLFIVNPAAGGGRARKLLPLVERVAGSRTPAADVLITDRPGHAVDVARNAAAQGYSRIIGVGGDGTLHEIANGIYQAGGQAALGAVPAGAGNDFVRSLGLPRDVEAALALAWDGAEQTIDMAACGDRVFLNAGGVGFDARVARAASGMPRFLRLGTLPYVAGVLREVVVNASDNLTLHLDDAVLERRSLMVAIANCKYYGGGMMICPDASNTDGLLDVCIVGGMSRRDVLLLLPKVFSGGHASHPLVEFYRSRTVEIEGLSRSEVQVDGELLTRGRVEFRCVPGALRVIRPRL
jgi:diacylglycerol kinase (ATP)